MIRRILAGENQKNKLEKKSFENLVLCNSLSLSNLPIRGENRLDVSANGEYILASNKSNVCLIQTISHLYNPLLTNRTRKRNCCCDSHTVRYATASSDNVLSKTLNYKTRCTSSMWYSDDHSIFLTAGDCAIDVWDSSVPEIAYSFSNLPSLVKCLSVGKASFSSPIIAGGLSCGTISLCDTRYGTSTNTCKPNFSADTTVVKFFKRNENQLIAGYANSSVLVWDLRKFNRPLHTISSSREHKEEPLIRGCSVKLGSNVAGSRFLEEKHSFDFKTEDELWNYIKGHETEQNKKRAFGNMSEEESKSNTGPNTRQRRVGPKKKGIDLSIHTGKKNDRLQSPKTQDHLNMPSNERKDVATDIKISDFDFNIYISHKNGRIECYNSTTFKMIKSMDVNLYHRNLEGQHITNKYSQKMKIQLISQDSLILFNHLDSVGIINLNKGSLIKYVRMKFREYEGFQSESNTDPVSGSSEPVVESSEPIISETRESQIRKIVMDISSASSIKEVYATNESGQLFLLHPGTSLPSTMIFRLQTDIYLIKRNF